MKLEIGKLYNVSRQDNIPFYLFSNIELTADKKALVLSDQTIMLLSDKIELSWGRHVYKVLIETGDIGYILDNSVKLVFAAIS